jgi:general secretion pathway protein F
MPEFSYRAVDQMGETTTGQLEAVSLAVASASLHRQGLRAIDIVEGKPTLWMRLNDDFTFFDRANETDIASFFKDLAQLMNAGMAIDQALNLQADMLQSGRFQKHLEQICEKVRRGASLSTAMSEEDGLFPVYILAAVNASENTGTLAQTLSSIAANMERAIEFRGKLKSALIYPSILLLMVMGTVALVITFVVPQFGPLFEGKEDQLPALTQFTMGLGTYVSENWQLVATGLTVLCVLTFAAYQHEESRSSIIKTLCKIPVIGYFLQTPDFIRFSRTLGVSTKNGLALDKALTMAIEAVDQIHMSKDLVTVEQKIRSGQALSEAFSTVPWMPILLIQFTKVGEHSGQLGSMLEEASNIISSDFEQKLERSLEIISPLLTLIMGGVVALLVGSVLLGIMSISNVAL